MAVGAGNAGDGDVTGWGKAFMDTGAGLKAMRAQRETADAAVGTKRGVDGDDRAVWMRTTDFCEEVCKVQGVNGLRQGAVNRQRAVGALQQRTGERAEAVADQTVSADAENDRRKYSGIRRLAKCAGGQLTEYGAGGLGAEAVKQLGETGLLQGKSSVSVGRMKMLGHNSSSIV